MSPYPLTPSPDVTAHYISPSPPPSPSIGLITITRPKVRNAFRPETIESMLTALRSMSLDTSIGCIMIRGQGPNFCAGGDQSVRGSGGYTSSSSPSVPPRLRVLDLHCAIKLCPKPVLALVRGFAIGGGHVLHMVCDLTIADETAVLGQIGPRMGSFDGGYGVSRLARLVGQKKAREVWWLCRYYCAAEAARMGLVNKVVTGAGTEWGVVNEGVRWCTRIMGCSPTAVACIKASCNAEEDGGMGRMQMAGMATRMYYMTEEGKEGRDAFLEKRKPEWGKVGSSKL
ncbi:hypothetical protein TrRE_jg6721 [Triparma retinervis]|uniref:Naphthoate synthase n=1 Tax=Triparma retinervis TaxID=2557542 RepID=A0A9W7FZS9_9STRA|nr:hypothetical protein TrRE_jg6721 [Triparma retinervis]